jgi:hypothetical protein
MKKMTIKICGGKEMSSCKIGHWYGKQLYRISQRTKTNPGW